MKRFVCAIFLLLSLFSLSFAENLPVKACDFADAVLPKAFHVYAAGRYAGLKQYIRIDSSGKDSGEFTVYINVTDKPVALILSANEPSVWQIKYTRNTNIAAVYLIGNFKQIITGLPEKTALLNAANVNYCDSKFIVSQDSLSSLNPLSQKLFGKSVDMVYFAKRGLITIGEKIDSDNYISFNARATVSFHDKTQPLDGDMGIRDALEKKVLRRATGDDLIPVYKYLKKGKPPANNIGRITDKTYVIEKDFIIPTGLSGAGAVVFILKKGIPYPKGNLGHSCLFDLNTNKAGSDCSWWQFHY
jgi:hypothetical protein